MEYRNLAIEHRHYIRKSAYQVMTPMERKIYLKHIKQMTDELNNLDESSSSESTTSDDSPPTYRDIRFVGMHHRGNHCFSNSDIIALVKDNSNLFDLSAIKVMLRDEAKWKHVAYVNRDDAKWLRSIASFHELPLKWVSNNKKTATYHIYLTDE